MYGRTQRCIRDLWKKYRQTGTTKDNPRSDRPPLLSLHQKKIVYRKARAQPKIGYKVLSEVGVLVNSDGTYSKPPSHSTLYRYLKNRVSPNLQEKSVLRLTVRMR